MEPEFHIEHVRLIFADQLVTKTLLANLNIESTCTLHGDQWHLLHSVFPLKFDTKRYRLHNIILPYLEQMLKCSIESDWKTFYHNAVELVQHEPRAFGDLEEIYNNPSYCSS